jgi:hypothetical protein
MSLEEVLYPRGVFLANAWSDIPVEEFRIKKNGGPSSAKSGPDTMKITMPYLSFYGSENRTAYRCWRFSLWHEAMHSKTPYSFFAQNKTTGIHSVMSVLEDQRVETLGRQIWKGMEDENKLIKAVVWNKTEEINEPVCSIGIFKLFVSKLILGRYKGHVASETRSKICEAVTFAKTAMVELLKLRTDDQIIDALRSSAEKIAVILNISENISYVPVVDRSSLLAGATQTTNDKDITKLLQEDFGIQKDAVEKIIKGDETLNLEWEKTQEELDEGIRQQKGGSGAVESIVTQEFDHLTTIDVRQDLVNKLVAAIRNWRFSWKEHLAKEGDELDDDFLSSKPFIAEDKLESRVRVGILLDHSGSIWPVELDYKKMTAILCQALQKVGIHYSLFAFSEPPSSSGVVIWLIKDGRRPFDRIAVDRLQRIEADGGTPLADVYKKLLPILMHRRIQKFITFTDGVPDNVEEASKAIKVLRRKGIQMSAVSYRCLDIRRLPYDRLDMIRDLDDLPKAVMKVFVGG